MNENFDIRAGVYVVPSIGRIDAREAISDETALKIYTLPRKQFPWISLTPSGASFLKKQKLTKEQVARLVLQAQSEEEVELLGELNDTKTVERVKETKLNSLKNEK